MPRQTGQVRWFGLSPNRVEHPQKILLSVKSWACTSRPIIVSYSMGYALPVNFQGNTYNISVFKKHHENGRLFFYLYYLSEYDVIIVINENNLLTL
jgi:hypothetical protein